MWRLVPFVLMLWGPVARAQDNVLLVVLDDVGVDRVGVYGAHPRPAPTPVLDCLATRGVRFTRCWSNPFCSPTRATIATGRYGFRTGIGTVLGTKLGTTGLSLDEWTLPEVIRRGSSSRYVTACLGKWHLSGVDQEELHPESSGFHVYAGGLRNLGPPGDEDAYYHWLKIIAGQATTVHRYATTDTADDVLRAVQSSGDEPWFIWAAFHAAHRPYHAPPPQLTDLPLNGDPLDSPALHHKAMVQALDAELGRVLAGIPPAVLARTTVVVVADNGTQGSASDPPTDPTHGKGTLWEGGVRVPLIVWGAAVSRPGVCDALVNTTDLFATLAELCGVDARSVVPPAVPLDSISLVPYLRDPTLDSLRDFAYAEIFKPNHADSNHTQRFRAVRGTRFKLVRDEIGGAERMHDLESDPCEERDLLRGGPLTPEQRSAYRDLKRLLAALDGG